MKNYKILIISILAASLTSCSESFFDLEPSNSVTVSKLYKTAGDFDLAVVGCYAKLQSQTSYYFECGEWRSDNLFLSAPTTGTQDRYDINSFKETPSNAILTDLWANFNNGVYRCNLVLDEVDGASIDEPLKKQYKGEALFVRALTYFNMYRLWGGVPTTRKAVSVSEALKIGRSSEEEMFSLMAGDLKQIVDEQLLPTAYGSGDAGRATLGAAQALLGKVYLTFHKWTEARDVLSQIIGKYTLQAEPGDVFDVSKKMNSEIIFAVRFNKAEPGEGHGFWYSVANLTDNKNQTAALLGSFTDPADKRRALVDYVKAPGESAVCVPQKFLDTRDGVTRNVGNDQILLRYADVLLMYAEALNEVAYSDQPNSPAMTSLNAVHTRSCPTEISITTLPDKESFRRAIMQERQREFPYEGHRWFDLVRMGYAKEAIKATLGIDIGDYQLLFPIPQSEIERISNASLLWQNPGYAK